MRRSPIRFALFLLATCAAASLLARAASPAPSDDAWRTILTASNTEGWAMVGPGEFKPVDGALETHGGMGLFWYTREKFANAQVRVVFQMTGEEDNSGVFIRIPEPPGTPWDAVNKGYEVQIYNQGDARHRTGVLYSLTEAKAAVSPKPGEWATLVVTLDGERTRVELNGTLVTDYVEGQPVPEKKESYEPDRGRRPEAGYVGLQNHGDPARVRFKEVAVRPLR